MLKKFTDFLTETDQEVIDYQIFCDLDGVLVDFNRGFENLDENKERLSPEEYEKKNGKNSIWPLIDAQGPDFWIDLQWMRDGRELWDSIKRYNPIILSSPSRSPSCIEGKTEWVKRNLKINQEPTIDPEEWDTSSRLILHRDKYKFAKSDKDILIDDTEAKLTKWTEAGGTGILHNDATDTIRVLDKIIR
jgi:phosphoglycolate phosphatase-like HAD superfamily hydrolase